MRVIREDRRRTREADKYIINDREGGKDTSSGPNLRSKKKEISRKYVLGRIVVAENNDKNRIILVVILDSSRPTRLPETSLILHHFRRTSHRLLSTNALATALSISNPPGNVSKPPSSVYRRRISNSSKLLHIAEILKRHTHVCNTYIYIYVVPV